MRKLKLNREPLAELGKADLAGIAAGITHGCTLYPTYHDLATCLKVLGADVDLPSIDTPCS